MWNTKHWVPWWLRIQLMLWANSSHFLNSRREYEGTQAETSRALSIQLTQTVIGKWLSAEAMQQLSVPDDERRNGELWSALWTDCTMGLQYHLKWRHASQGQWFSVSGINMNAFRIVYTSFQTRDRSEWRKVWISSLGARHKVNNTKL
jgi:hypothetical protein